MSLTTTISDGFFLGLCGSIAKAICYPFERSTLAMREMERRNWQARVDSLNDDDTGNMVTSEVFEFADGSYVRHSHQQYVLFDKSCMLIARVTESELTIALGRNQTEETIAILLHDAYIGE